MAAEIPVERRIASMGSRGEQADADYLARPTPSRPGAGGAGGGASIGERAARSSRSLTGVIRRQWWVLLIVVMVMVAAAGAYVIFGKPVYEGSAALQLDIKSPSPGADAMAAAAALADAEAVVPTELEVLRGRVLMQQVVDELGLAARIVAPKPVARDLWLSQVHVAPTADTGMMVLRRDSTGKAFIVRDAKTGKQLGRAVWGIPTTVRGVTLTVTTEALTIPAMRVHVSPRDAATQVALNATNVFRASREANVVRIRYRDTDPHLVRDVPNTLAAAFIRDRNRVRRSDATGTVAFLKQQIDTISGQLHTQEDALRRFRQRGHVVDLKAQGGAEVARAEDLQTQRTNLAVEQASLNAMLSHADSSAATLRASQQRQTAQGSGLPPTSPYRTLAAFPGFLRYQAASELMRALATADEQRATLLMRRTPSDADVALVSAHIAQIEGQLRDMGQAYLGSLNSQIRSIDGALQSSQATLAGIPATEMEYTRLQRGTGVLENLSTMLQTRLKESEIGAASVDPSVRLIDPAVAPARPIRPRPALYGAVAVINGVFLGLAVAFWRDGRDRTVHTRDELAALTGERVLAIVPRIEADHRRTTRSGLLLSGQSRAAAAYQSRMAQPTVQEAYNRIDAGLGSSGIERPMRVLLVTSPLSGEGKTTTAINIATTLGARGARVLLIDADLRRAGATRALGLHRTPGLSDVVCGSVPLDAAVQVLGSPLEKEGLPISVLPSGSPVAASAAVLRSPKLTACLRRVAAAYDVVIIDAPPVNVVADTILLSAHVDGVLLVARAGVTRLAALAYASEQLATARAPVIGSILNHVDRHREASYDPAYQYDGSYDPYYVDTDPHLT
jgi:polysaccharide biosynthesis transport protein